MAFNLFLLKPAVRNLFYIITKHKCTNICNSEIILHIKALTHANVTHRVSLL